MEDITSSISTITSEALIMKKLNTSSNVEENKQEICAQFFPKYYEHGLSNQTSGGRQYNFLIMDFLELSIMDYLQLPEQTLNLSQICQGMLRALEAFHNQRYIHRNVTPENFRIHLNRVYLIDFSQSREYQTKDGKHIPYAANKQFRGTSLTSSIFTHQSIDQSRRDDLISMVYSAMCIFEKGNLPWSQECNQLTTNVNNQRILDKIFDIKRTVGRHSFNSQITKNLFELVKKLEQIKFEETPNYNAIAQEFNNIFIDDDVLKKMLENQQQQKINEKRKKEIGEEVKNEQHNNQKQIKDLVLKYTNEKKETEQNIQDVQSMKFQKIESEKKLNQKQQEVTEVMYDMSLHKYGLEIGQAVFKNQIEDQKIYLTSLEKARDDFNQQTQEEIKRLNQEIQNSKEWINLHQEEINQAQSVIQLETFESQKNLDDLNQSKQKYKDMDENYKNQIIQYDEGSQNQTILYENKDILQELKLKIMKEGRPDNKNKKKRTKVAPYDSQYIIQQQLQNCNYHIQKDHLPFITLNKAVYLINQQNEGIFEDFSSFPQDWINSNEILKQLNSIITLNGFTFESPFVIALCDAIQAIGFDSTKVEPLEEEDDEEEEDYEEEADNQNNLKENMKTAIQRIDLYDCVLEKVRCLAFFKFYASHLCNQIVKTIQYPNQEVYICESLVSAFHESFQDNKVQDLQMLMLYVVKQFYQKLEPDQIQGSACQRLDWLKYVNLPQQTEEKFNQPFDQDRQQQLRLESKESISIPQGEPPNMQVILNLLEIFYLNKKDEELRSMYVKRVSEAPNLTLERKTFLLSFLKMKKEDNPFVYNSICIDFNSEEKRNIRKIQILQAYVAAAVYSAPQKSFIYKMGTNPDIANIFLPFMRATKNDSQYFQKFPQNSFLKKQFKPATSHLFRYKCENCNHNFEVLDSGILNNQRGAPGLKAREINCLKCGLRVGAGECLLNTIREDLAHLAKDQFYEFLEKKEAEKGFVQGEEDNLDGICIRFWINANSMEKWDEAQFRFGLLAFYFLLMISTLFGSEKSCKQLGQSIGLKDAQQIREECYQFFLVRVSHGFERLKTLFEITDEKLMAVLMETIRQLLLRSNDPELQLDKLQTPIGRREFEAYFLKNCVPDSEGSFQQFIKGVPISSLEIASINEKVEIQSLLKNENTSRCYYSILRNQIPINLQQINNFINFYKKTQSIDSQSKSKFEYLILEQALLMNEYLDLIKHLKTIIQWFKYSSSRWRGKITIFDSIDFSVQEIIERDYNYYSEGIESQDFDESRYRQDLMWLRDIQEATKALSHIQLVDGCDNIKITALNDQSRFQHYCVTTINKRSLGQPLGLIINYLAQKQNQFLEAIAIIPEFKWLQDRSSSTVKLFSMEDQQFIKTDLNLSGLIQLVKQGSYSELDYGRGQINHYMLDQINQQLTEELISHKVFIDYSDPINFPFSDELSLNNIYSIIKDNFEQEVLKSSLTVIANLKNEREKFDLLTGLRTAINFLYKSLLQESISTDQFIETPLIYFMNSKQIDVGTNVGNEARIKHILYLFEETEKCVLDSLVERTNEKYKQDLKQKKLKQLDQIVNKMQNTKLEKVIHILGRLCVRHLTLDENVSEKRKIFEELFQDFYGDLHGITRGSVAAQQPEQEVIQEVLGQRVNEPLSNNRYLEELQSLLAPTGITYGEAYNTYQILRKCLNRKLQEEAKEAEDSKETKAKEQNLDNLADQDIDQIELDRRAVEMQNKQPAQTRLRSYSQGK